MTSIGTVAPDLSAHPNETDSAVVRLVTLALRQARLILVTGILVATVTVLYLGLRPARYTAAASFTPQVRRVPSAASAGIAAQLGITIASGDGGQSPQFYNELLQARAVLEPVVKAKYQVPGKAAADSAPLFEILQGRGDNEAQRVESSLRVLRERFQSSVSIRSGLVGFEVTLADPRLAYDVIRTTLDELQRFNISTRQTSAKAERRFTELRVQDVRSDLRRLEDSLQTFLTENRDFRASPRLTFISDRLSREVQVRQALYGQVLQALEQARIEEIRDTPVLSVVDSPIVPSRPDSRMLLRYALVAVVLGLLLGLALAIGWEYWTNLLRTSGPDGDELRARWGRLRLIRSRSTQRFGEQ